MKYKWDITNGDKILEQYLGIYTPNKKSSNTFFFFGLNIKTKLNEEDIKIFSENFDSRA